MIRCICCCSSENVSKTDVNFFRDTSYLSYQYSLPHSSSKSLTNPYSFLTSISESKVVYEPWILGHSKAYFKIAI